MGRPRTDPSRPSAKARIRSAAEEAFAAFGVHGATQREIARLAGVNVNLIGYYYPDKVDIFADIVATRTEQQFARAEMLLEEALARHAPEPPPVAEIFTALLRPNVQLQDEEPGAWTRYLRVIGKEEGSDHWRAALIEATGPMVGRFHGALRLALPSLKPADTLFLITLAYHCTALLSMDWDLRAVRTDPEARLAKLEEQLVKSLVGASAAFI